MVTVYLSVKTVHILAGPKGSYPLRMYALAHNATASASTPSDEFTSLRPGLQGRPVLLVSILNTLKQVTLVELLNGISNDICSRITTSSLVSKWRGVCRGDVPLVVASTC